MTETAKYAELTDLEISEEIRKRLQKMHVLLSDINERLKSAAGRD